MNENVLLDNKRELFDGMRAYQQSEQVYIKNAVTMLLFISGVVGSFMVKVLLEDSVADRTATVWILFVVNLLLSFFVSFITHIKVKSDHHIYANFGEEYVRTCRALGFYDQESPVIKRSEKIGSGKGYQYSLFVIWGFSFLSVLLTFFFAILFKSIT